MSPETTLALAERIAALAVATAGFIAGTAWAFGATTLGEAAPAVFIAIGFDLALKMLRRAEKED